MAKDKPAGSGRRHVPEEDLTFGSAHGEESAVGTWGQRHSFRGQAMEKMQAFAGFPFPDADRAVTAGGEEEAIVGRAGESAHAGRLREDIGRVSRKQAHLPRRADLPNVDLSAQTCGGEVFAGAIERETFDVESGGRIGFAVLQSGKVSGEIKLEKEWKVVGEVLDVSVSSGENPTLAAISIDLKKGETLSIFEATKKAVSSMRLSYHVEQVETFPTGKLVAVYGNSPRGKYIAVHSGYDGTLQWQKLEPRYADYSLAIRVGEDRILAGFEQGGSAKPSPGGAKSRSTTLIALDLDGKLRADLPLKTAEGAYLYAFAYSPDRSLLGVGTDDKRIQLFELR